MSGIILLAEGHSNESGGIQLSISQETSHKSVSLPLAGEEFAQTVAREIGRRQP